MSEWGRGWGNGADGGKMNFSRKTCISATFSFYHKAYLNWPGIEPGPAR